MPKAPDPIDVKVGAKIRARRRLVGMTQERLAAILGVTFQQIQKYEKGTNRVSASRLQTLAGALQTPVWHFFPDSGHSMLALAPASAERIHSVPGFARCGRIYCSQMAFDNPQRSRVISCLKLASARCCASSWVRTPLISP